MLQSRLFQVSIRTLASYGQVVENMSCFLRTPVHFPRTSKAVLMYHNVAYALITFPS